MRGARGSRSAGVAVLVTALVGNVGCFHTQGMVGPGGPDMAAGPGHTGGAPIAVPPPGAVPRELALDTLPPYVVSPPDTLLIQVGVRGQIPVTGADGVQLKDPEGKPLTQEGIRPLPVQDIGGGSFLVRPDGSIGLGFWGSVPLAGLTLDQAAEAIRQHLLRTGKLGKTEGLGTQAENLIVIVDVLAYNSKRYYVITDGGGYGEQVFPFYITGSETVLDAVGNINGLPTVASKRNIWVARRCPLPDQPWQILPVDWVGITQHGITQTNYQIMPGDRIYVKAQRLITFDTALSRIFAPIERVFGVVLLGSSTVNQIQGRGNGFGNSN